MQLAKRLSVIRPDLSAIKFESYARESLPLPPGDLWVFGYGSLMWNPGFVAARATPAKLYGYHRRLCLWSIHYRGSARQPGLVLGLDRGGSCNGVALRVARAQTAAVCDYLVKREMINNAYRPAVKTVHLRGGGAVAALTFLSKRDHPQFARRLDLDAVAAVVCNARGRGGKNCDYVLNTAKRLSEVDIHRTEIHRVAERINYLHHNALQPRRMRNA